MKPDNSTPSGQGVGTRNEKTGKTVSMDDIPQENRAFEEIDEGVTEGALPKTSGEPNTTGITDKGRRQVNRGLHS